MKLKFYVFCPDKEDVINKVIDAAAQAGAGKIGNYSHCSFITKGQGNWKSEEGSDPAIGEVGKMSRVDEVKIEMECEAAQVKAVVEGIKQVHPYEEVVIDFIKIEDFDVNALES